MRRIAQEQIRRGHNDPLTWFMAYRRIRGLTPEVIHALATIFNDPSSVIVIQKAAQVGVTELLVSLALWAADTGYAGRGNVLYLMPTKGQMDDFVQSRFNQAIQESTYLTNRLRPDPPGRRGADNNQIKRIGNSFIYFRGTESVRAISSVDADLVILDEFDQMAAGTQERVLARIASSTNGKIVIASTPKIPGAGINALYLKSDRNVYHIPCPSCGLEQPLEWDGNVNQEEAKIICTRCGLTMIGSAEGRWVPVSDRPYPLRGYHLNQLYSSKLDLRRLIDLSKRPGISATEEFHNSYLGEPFAAEGGGIQLAVIDNITDEYSLEDYDGQPCVMGVDVGTRLHVVIREDISENYPSITGMIGNRRSERHSKLWYAGDVSEIGEIEQLMVSFNVKSVVIDALPETRLSRDFANRHGDVHMAYYTGNNSSYEWIRETSDKPRHVKIDRLVGMDDMYTGIRNGTVRLPADARELGGHINSDGYGEYAAQMMVPQRILEKDGHGNPVARWIDNGRDDHYAHAELYCMLAQQNLIHIIGVF